MKTSMFNALAATAILAAATTHAAPFLDDFSTDTSANYTATNTSGSGGSFNIDGGQMTIVPNAGNALSVAHDTARLEVGEYVAVDVMGYGFHDFALFVSTIDRQPAGGGSGAHGIRFQFLEQNWRPRLVNGGSQTNITTNDPVDAGDAEVPFTMFIFRDTETNYRLAVDIGNGVQFLTVSGSETVTIAGTDGVSGLYIGIENWVTGGDAVDVENRWASFDNLRIVPEPASLVLMGLGGLVMLRRRRG